MKNGQTETELRIELLSTRPSFLFMNNVIILRENREYDKTARRVKKRRNSIVRIQTTAAGYVLRSTMCVYTRWLFVLALGLYGTMLIVVFL